MAADAAGDTESAALFADEIRKLQTAAAPSVSEQYDQMGTLGKIGTAAGDVVRLAGSGAGFGYSEKALAGIKSMLGQGEYDDLLVQERLATEQARERAGSAATPASVLGPMGVASGVSRMLPQVLQAAPTGNIWQRLAGSVSAGALEGGAYGALEAAGNDRDISEGATTGAGFGAFGGALSEGFLSAVNALSGRKMGNPPPAPTKDDLMSESKALRKEAADQDVFINPDTIADLNQTLYRNVGEGNSQGARNPRHRATISELDRYGEYTPSLQSPKTKSTRTIVDSDGATRSTTATAPNPPSTKDTTFRRQSDTNTTRTTVNTGRDRGMSLYDLDQHRQTTQMNVARHPDDAEAKFGYDIIRELDNLADNLDGTKATVAKGTIPEAVDKMKTARELDHRRLKLKDIEGPVEAAKRQQSASSGVPNGSDVRSTVAGILRNDRNVQGFSADERQMMEDIVSGSKAANRWRDISQKGRGMMGGAVGGAAGFTIGSLLSGGMGGGFSGGALGAGAGVGAARLLADYAAGKASRATEKQVEELLDTIARGYKVSARQSPQIVKSDLKRTARELLTFMGLEEYNTQ